MGRLLRRSATGPPDAGAGDRSGGRTGGRRRRWLLGGLVLVLVGALAWVILGTEVFGVRRIEVTGSQIAAPDRVRAVAAVDPGTPLARIDTVAVSQRVRALPSVAEVAVTRSWPNTLRIAVTERAGVASVAIDGRFVILDSDGVVFHTVAERPEDLVLLRVQSPGPDDAATRAALAVVGVLTPQLREQLRVLVADEPHRLRLELRGGGTVLWGGADGSERKAQVVTALLAESRGRTIDVSAPGVATVS
jgi:cell division protein FtsQ